MAGVNVINLGCGLVPLAGAVNHDIRYHSPHVDAAWNLNNIPWPWMAETFDEIYAYDLVEHLNSFMEFFDEAWRILKPQGTCTVRVPRYDAANVIIDPTHKRGYHRDCFQYLDPTTYWGEMYARVYTDRHWKLIGIDDQLNITAQLQKVGS